MLAVEVARAPYHSVVNELKGTDAGARELKGRGTPYCLSWNACEVEDVQLTARDGRGLAPSAAPAGLQVCSGEAIPASQVRVRYAIAWDAIARYMARKDVATALRHPNPIIQRLPHRHRPGTGTGRSSAPRA